MFGWFFFLNVVNYCVYGCNLRYLVPYMIRVYLCEVGVCVFFIQNYMKRESG